MEGLRDQGGFEGVTELEGLRVEGYLGRVSVGQAPV